MHASQSEHGLGVVGPPTMDTEKRTREAVWLCLCQRSRYRQITSGTSSPRLQGGRSRCSVGLRRWSQNGQLPNVDRPKEASDM